MATSSSSGLGQVIGTDRVAAVAKETATALTRLFRQALENGRLNAKKAANCIAAWKIRENTVGVDYSHGACQDMLGLAGLSLQDDVASQCLQQTPCPEKHDFDLEQLYKSWTEIDDGRSSISCMIYKRGHWTIMANSRFQETFASREEIEDKVHQTRSLPSLYYASTVSHEDQLEFANLICQTYFLTEGEYRGDYTSILKCVDRRGASFLSVVRMQLACFGDGGHIGLLLSILPLPRSPYLKGDCDLIAPVFRPLRVDASSTAPPLPGQFPLFVPAGVFSCTTTATAQDQGVQFQVPASAPLPSHGDDVDSGVDELLRCLLNSSSDGVGTTGSTPWH